MEEIKLDKITDFFSSGMLIIILATVVGVVVSAWLGIPGFLNGMETSSQITQLQSELNDVNDKISLLEGYNEEEYLDRMDTVLHEVLPVESDLAIAIAIIAELANQVGIEIESGSVREFLDDEVVDPLAQPIKLTVRGQHDEFKTFIERLYAISPVMRIDSIRVNANVQESTDDQPIGEKVVSAELNLNTYVKPAENIEVSSIVDKKIPVLTAEDEQFYQKIAELEVLEFDLPENIDDPNRNPFQFGN